MSLAGERLRRSALFGYGLAIVSVGTAFALAIVLLRFNSPLALTPFELTAIAITFWYSSTRPGIFAVFLSTLVRSYFFPPETSIASRMLYDSAFLGFALVMIWVTRERNELEAEVAERTAELARANEKLKLEIAEGKEAEDRTRLIINTIPTMAWTIRPDGAVDFLNQRWLDYTGLSLEQEIELPMRVLHPDDVSRAVEKWREDMADGKPYEDEMRLQRADGEYRWFLVRTAPQRDEQGNVVRWYGVSIDIEDRKQAEEQVRRLSGQLLRSQDEERRRIARELHDSTGQNLVALATMLGQLSSTIPTGERKARAILSECRTLADQCIREVRTLSYVLHSPVLEESGLQDAIRDYVKGFTNRSGIQVELELSPRLGRMDRDVEVALFRVVQEALTNVQRHSGSKAARIRIDRDGRDGSLTLEISDLGHGFAAEIQNRKEAFRFESGLGILSMQQRVKLIGGQLDISSTSEGTTVRVTIPLGENGREKTSNPDR